MKKASDYMNIIKEALGSKLIQSDEIYSEKEGHLRFAREIGCGLHDFNKYDAKHIKENSYNIIYIIGCQLKPLLSSKEWIAEIERGYQQAEYSATRLYNEIEVLAEDNNFYKKILKDLYYDEIQQQTYSTKNEIIELLDDMIKTFNIKNIIDFKTVVEKY